MDQIGLMIFFEGHKPPLRTLMSATASFTSVINWTLMMNDLSWRDPNLYGAFTYNSNNKRPLQIPRLIQLQDYLDSIESSHYRIDSSSSSSSLSSTTSSKSSFDVDKMIMITVRRKILLDDISYVQVPCRNVSKNPIKSCGKKKSKVTLRDFFSIKKSKNLRLKIGKEKENIFRRMLTKMGSKETNFMDLAIPRSPQPLDQCYDCQCSICGGCLPNTSSSSSPQSQLSSSPSDYYSDKNHNLCSDLRRVHHNHHHHRPKYNMTLISDKYEKRYVEDHSHRAIQIYRSMRNPQNFIRRSSQLFSRHFKDITQCESLIISPHKENRITKESSGQNKDCKLLLLTSDLHEIEGLAPSEEDRTGSGSVKSQGPFVLSEDNADSQTENINIEYEILLKGYIRLLSTMNELILKENKLNNVDDQNVLRTATNQIENFHSNVTNETVVTDVSNYFSNVSKSKSPVDKQIHENLVTELKKIFEENNLHTSRLKYLNKEILKQKRCEVSDQQNKSVECCSLTTNSLHESNFLQEEQFDPTKKEKEPPRTIPTETSSTLKLNKYFDHLDDNLPPIPHSRLFPELSTSTAFNDSFLIPQEQTWDNFSTINSVSDLESETDNDLTFHVTPLTHQRQTSTTPTSQRLTYLGTSKRLFFDSPILSCNVPSAP